MQSKYEGYLALAVAIGCVCTVESAFARLDSPRPSVVKDMHQLKVEGLTCREIGEIYGLTSRAVFNRMGRGSSLDR